MYQLQELIGNVELFLISYSELRQLQTLLGQYHNYRVEINNKHTVCHITILLNPF